LSSLSVTLFQNARIHSAVAQSNLGLKYAQGEGVSEDYAEAIKWWRLSAE
jgi:TPR repeat protein